MAGGMQSPELINSFREDINKIFAVISNAQDIARERKEILRHLELAIGEMSFEEPEMENGSANAQLQLMKVYSEESTGNVEGLEVEVVQSEVGPSWCHLLGRQLDHNLFHGEGEVPIGFNIPGDSFLLVNVEQICKEIGSSKWDPGGMSLQIEFSLVGLDSAYKVFDKMFERDVFSWTSLLCGYAKHGEIARACEIFNQMPECNNVSWTIVISALVGSGWYVEALSHFRDMLRDDKLQVNETILVCVLSACSPLGALDHGNWIHTYMGKCRIPGSSNISTALIDMYSKCGRVDSAIRVFKGISRPDVHNFTSMISGLSVHGLGKDVLHVFQQMVAENTKSNKVTCLGVLNAYSHSGLVLEGFSIFYDMESLGGVAPKIEHYGCYIDLLGRAGYLEKAFQIVKTMPMKPDIVIWRSLLNGCRIHRDFNFAWCIINHIGQMNSQECTEGEVLPSNLYTSLSMWEGVTEVRKLIGERRFEPDVVVYSSLVHRWCKAGNIPEAERVFHEMKMAGVTSNLYTYSTVIEALCRNGQITHTHDVFAEMIDVGCEPNLVTYNNLMREEKVQQGMEILQTLEQEFYHLHSMHERKCEHLSYEEAVQAVEDFCLEEGKKREHGTVFVRHSYETVLRKRPEEFIKRDSEVMFISSRIEMEVLSNILKDAENLNGKQFGFEETYSGMTSHRCDLDYGEDDDGRTKDYMHQVDSCIEVAIQSQNEQLATELSKLDARMMRNPTGMRQLEIKLEHISAHDYRLVLLPLVKSIVRARLKDLAEKDAIEKTDAAREAFLAEHALDSQKGSGGGSDVLKQALAELMVFIFGRPRGFFKEGGKWSQTGLQVIQEKLVKLGIGDGDREVELQHSAIWMAGVCFILLMHFLENKVAWSSYEKYAWVNDELQPQLKNGANSLGGLGATLIASLDTLYIMGLNDQFYRSREWVASLLDYFFHRGQNMREGNQILTQVLLTFDPGGTKSWLDA